MVACEQGGEFRLLLIQVCTEFHVICFFIAVKYFLSTMLWVLQNIAISYRQWKIKTLVLAQKSFIKRALPKIQPNFISKTCSLVQPTIYYRIDSGIDLIVKSPNYHCFWSQRIYYITITVCSYEHGTEKIPNLSNIQQMSAIQQWELLSKRTYTYKIEADNQMHNCICGALSIKDGGVINIFAKSLQRRTIELQLLWWFCIIM